MGKTRECQSPTKTMPPTAKRSGALAGSALAAEPDDQSEDGAVQPAFSAISRPWVKQLELMDTSSEGIENAGTAFESQSDSKRAWNFHGAASGTLRQ